MWFHCCPLGTIFIGSRRWIEIQDSRSPHTIFVSLQTKTVTRLPVGVFRYVRPPCVIAECEPSPFIVHQPKQSSEPVAENVIRQKGTMSLSSGPAAMTSECQNNLLLKLNIALTSGSFDHRRATSQDFNGTVAQTK